MYIYKLQITIITLNKISKVVSLLLLKNVLPGADLAFFAELFLRHSEIGIVTETGLAQDGELGLLPVHPVVRVRTFRCRHFLAEKN